MHTAHILAVCKFECEAEKKEKRQKSRRDDAPSSVLLLPLRCAVYEHRSERLRVCWRLINERQQRVEASARCNSGDSGGGNRLRACERLATIRGEDEQKRYRLVGQHDSNCVAQAHIKQEERKITGRQRIKS